MRSNEVTAHTRDAVSVPVCQIKQGKSISMIRTENSVVNSCPLSFLGKIFTVRHVTDKRSHHFTGNARHDSEVSSTDSLIEHAVISFYHGQNSRLH